MRTAEALTRINRGREHTAYRARMSAAQTPVDAGAVTLCAEALSKVYHVGEVDIHALRGVDVTLHAGELCVLLGPLGKW